MVLEECMAVEHHFLDRSALVLLDELAIVLAVAECQQGNDLGNILLAQVVGVRIRGTVVPQVNLAVGKRYVCI